MKMPVAFTFAGFIFWLLSFPMEGVLLGGNKEYDLIVFFLFSHIVILYFLSITSREYDLNLLADSGVILTGLSTLLFPFSGEYGLIFVVLCGVGAAPILMRLGILIKNSPNSFKQIVIGLAAGNFLTFVITIIPVGLWSYVFISIGVALSFGLSAVFIKKPVKPILKYQPLVFVLYTMGGVMYGFLTPGYLATDPVPGIELFFYIFAAFLGWYFFSKELKGMLYIAIALALMSQPALYGIDPFFFTAGVFFMQSSMGFADFFILTIAVSYADPARAIGLNSANLCLGILAGLLMSMLHIEVIIMVALLGNLGLASSIILLMFIEKKKQSEQEFFALPVAMDKNILKSMTEEFHSGAESCIDKFEISSLVTESLSPRENEVLEKVILQNMLYREAAEDLGISESTVKTYMKRIYIKTGVKSKKNLDEICREDRDEK